MKSPDGTYDVLFHLLTTDRHNKLVVSTPRGSVIVSTSTTKAAAADPKTPIHFDTEPSSANKDCLFRFSSYKPTSPLTKHLLQSQARATESSFGNQHVPPSERYFWNKMSFVSTTRNQNSSFHHHRTCLSHFLSLLLEQSTWHDNDYEVSIRCDLRRDDIPLPICTEICLAGGRQRRLEGSRSKSHERIRSRTGSISIRTSQEMDRHLCADQWVTHARPLTVL